jgi:pimeloyl-ACP methyl ester carboxylesterase
MSNLQTGFADINGAHIYYQTAGAGRTITFVHAGVADHRLWDAQFEALQSTYRVISYDLRGYGQSTAPAMPYSHSEDLHALLGHLGVERTALVACSMGGTAALDTVLTYPDIATALVMVCSDPSGYMPEGAPPPLILQLVEASKAGDAEKMANVAVLLWGVGERRKPEQVDQQFRDLVYDMSLIGFRNQLAGMGQELTIAQPAIGRLNEVRIPTLIIDGAEDSPTTHTAGELMAKGIAGSRRKLMANVAHLPSLENPIEFNKLLIPFLAEVLE